MPYLQAPIHAVSSHVATDKGPSIDGGKFRSTKLAAAIFGWALYGGGVLPAQYYPCDSDYTIMIVVRAVLYHVISGHVTCHIPRLVLLHAKRVCLREYMS